MSKTLGHQAKLLDRDYDALKWSGLYHVLNKAYKVEQVGEYLEKLKIAIPGEKIAYIELEFYGRILESNKPFRLSLKEFDFDKVKKSISSQYNHYTVYQVIRTIEMLMDKVATYRS